MTQESRCRENGKSLQCESVNGIAPLRWGTDRAKISFLHGEEPQLPSPHRRPDGLLSLSLSLSLNARFARARRAPYIFPSALLVFLWLQPYCESCSQNLVSRADRCGKSRCRVCAAGGGEGDRTHGPYRSQFFGCGVEFKNYANYAESIIWSRSRFRGIDFFASQASGVDF